MGVEASGASAASYVTYGPFGLYVRLGSRRINGYSERHWGGYYYAAAEEIENYAPYSAPANRTVFAAFEVRPWGFPVPYSEISSVVGWNADQLRHIVAALLTPHSASIKLGLAHAA